MKFRLNTTTEKIENTGGLILAGIISKKIGLHFTPEDKIPHSEVIRSMFGLLVQGRTSFEEIDLFRNSDLFRNAFDLKYVPAKETLRLYLKRIAELESIPHTALSNINMNLLRKVALTPIETDILKYIPVDIDVSPLDNSRTKKKGVGRTYKGYDGFAPIFSYIGAEGYMLDCELRPGKQHCQNNTPQFIQKIVKQLEKLKKPHPYLFRLDSGNDSLDNLKILLENKHFLLIKRNLRKESPLYWLDIAKLLGSVSSPREGKNVYTGVITKNHSQDDSEKPNLDIVFKVTERTSDHFGNPYLIPTIDIETYWTNLYESPEKVIELYHDHGTSEQFHSELKTDMDVERLPSGDFSVNSLILKIAMIAFNTLRYIGQTALSKKQLLPVKTFVKRKRLKKVISDLIFVACKFIYRSRQFFIRIWEKNPWHKVFQELYSDFCSL